MLALAAAGYVIVPVATAEQIAALDVEHKAITERIAETRANIRAPGRFKL